MLELRYKWPPSRRMPYTHWQRSTYWSQRGRLEAYLHDDTGPDQPSKRYTDPSSGCQPIPTENSMGRRVRFGENCGPGKWGRVASLESERVTQTTCSRGTTVPVLGEARH